MSEVSWDNIKDLVDSVLEIPAEQRASYLDQHCSDPQVRRSVDALIKSYEESVAFFHEPAVVDHLLEDGSWIGRRVGPYKILEEIGAGGMGVVYRGARADDEYSQHVAIKVVGGIFASTAHLERFRTERQILANLNHPNIARMLDGGTTPEGLPFLVMEFIDGIPVNDYCNNHRLPLRQRLELFLEVCDAVQYAHQNLVVHRDLKPGNILVATDRTPKLLDFGIAKILEPIDETANFKQPRTIAALRVMTPEYASPEQMEDRPVTTASDVYSLGVVLYGLLTGGWPYVADSSTPDDIAQAVKTQSPRRPSTAIGQADRDASISEKVDTDRTPLLSECFGEPAKQIQKQLVGDLDAIVLKSLERDLSRRYSSVEQLSGDIRRFLSGQPVRARMPTLRYRVAKFVRRNTAAVSVAFAVVIASLIAVAWIVHAERTANRERARAETRFNDVRELANSLMFEIHDSIKDLPGSTPARKLLVDRSLRYLDSLSRESSGDPALQRELAAAYEKVGDVQGNSAQLGLGDTASALTDYQKALAIRLRLDSSHFDLRDQLALAADHRWIGVILLNKGDTGSALNSANESIRVTEGLAREAPANPQVLRELEQDYQAAALAQGGGGPAGSLGDFEESLANNRKALAIAERLLKIEPNNVEERNQLARYKVRIGDDLHLLGRRSEALEYYREALRYFETLDSGTNAMQQLRTMVVYSRISSELLANGDPSGSLRNARRELAIIEPLAAADRRNAVLQLHLAAALAEVGRGAAKVGDVAEGLRALAGAATVANEQLAHDPSNVEPRAILATVMVWEGEVWASRGSLTEALRQFRRSLSILGELSTADPKNVDFLLNVAAVHVKLGSVLVALGQPREAEHEYREALAIDQGVARGSSPPAEIQYTRADSYFGLGKVEAALAAAARQRPQQIEHWSQARSYYQESLETWKGIHNPAHVSPAGFGCGSPMNSNQAVTIADAALTKLRDPLQH